MLKHFQDNLLAHYDRLFRSDFSTFFFLSSAAISHTKNDVLKTTSSLLAVGFPARKCYQHDQLHQDADLNVIKLFHSESTPEISASSVL